MIEMKHNTLKLRNPENLRFEAVPGLVLGVNSQDIVPAIEEVVEPVIQEVAIAAVAENSYVKDGDEIKQLIFEMTHPIGSIIYTSNSANPSTYLGGGTWTQIQGRFLLGASSSYTAGSTGGEATHTLTTAEIPAHSHRAGWKRYDAYGSGTLDAAYWSNGVEGANVDYYTSSVGGGTAHNNMPPYKVVYIWERTA